MRSSLSGSLEWLNREERRELASKRQLAHPYHIRVTTSRWCLYCRGPLANGRAVCSDECDDGWWSICPTIDGDLWTSKELLDTVPALDITAVAPRGRAMPWLEEHRARLRQDAQARYKQIRDLAKLHPDWTSRQLAEHVGLSPSAVHRALQGSGYTWPVTRAARRRSTRTAGGGVAQAAAEGATIGRTYRLPGYCRARVRVVRTFK